jgi:DNA-binding MarR family transcriptional regulator
MDPLKDGEKKILSLLSKKGAATPFEISVDQLMMPDEVIVHIDSLEEHGLIKRMPTKSSANSEVITINEKGKKTLKEGLL